MGGGWELVEHFVIGPDTDTSWSRCSDHQSREWRRLRVGEVSLPTIVTTPPQKATTSCRSHKAPSPHITDVRQPQEDLQSSNESIDSSFKIAMHACRTSSSMRFVRSPCKRSSQQTISRCGISAAKTFTTGGSRQVDHLPFYSSWWYFQYIQTLKQYHFLSAGLLNG